MSKPEDIIASAPVDSDVIASADGNSRPPRRKKGLFSFCGCFRSKREEPDPPPTCPPKKEEIAHDLVAEQTQIDPANFFLPPQQGANVGRKTLVLDLDETLVHSSFRPVKHAHITLDVEIDGKCHKVYVLKRPFCQEFLSKVAKLYEVVIYTASLAKYADPLMDILDLEKNLDLRLFREACTRLDRGGYVKDLNYLGRDLRKVAIIDNSPTCYSMQPHNGIPISTWRGDTEDRELLDLIPILEALVEVANIPMTLQVVLSMDPDEAPATPATATPAVDRSGPSSVAQPASASQSGGTRSNEGGRPVAAGQASPSSV